MKKEVEKYLTEHPLKMFLYLFFVCSISVSQFLIHMFAENPVYLVAHEIRGKALVISLIIINFILPILLWCLLMIIGAFSKISKEWMARFIMVFFMGLFSLSLFKSLNAMPSMIFSLSLSLIFVYFLVQVKTVKLFAMWLSPIYLLLSIYLLFFSGINQLIIPIQKSNSSNQIHNAGPVFVFVLDEFPLHSLLKNPEKIDEKLFPTFNKIANEFTWYTNAKAISSATHLSIPAILSGIDPKTANKRVATVEQYPINLFTQLSATHSVNSIENTSRLCPKYLCKSIISNPIELFIEDTFIIYFHHIAPKNLRERLPHIDNKWIGFLQDVEKQKFSKDGFSQRLKIFQNFIDSFSQFPEKTVHFLHVLMPHAPWTMLPDLKSYAFHEKEGVVGALAKNHPEAQYSHHWTNDKWATMLSWQRQLLQIGAVDTMMSKAISEIKELGLYDDATIVIVSDHGSSFIPGQARRYAHDDNTIDISAIPLFIKYPHQKAGLIDDRIANNLDIIPTLQDLFNISDIDSEMTGLSLISPIKRTQEMPLYQEGSAEIKLPVNAKKEFQLHIDEKNNMFKNIGWEGVYHPIGTEDFYEKDLSFLSIESFYKNAISLQNSNLFVTNELDAQYIPAYYRVQLHTLENNIEEIIVALNGKLVSHCKVFKKIKNACAGIINPKEFQQLEKQQPLNLRFFAVKEKSDKGYKVIELMRKDTDSASIQMQNKQEHISFSSGRTINIDKNYNIFGQAVIRIIENGNRYHIDGWAGDTLSGTPADEILVFSNKKLIAQTKPEIHKQHLYKTYGQKELLNSGYQITITPDQFNNIANSHLRVFAIFKDTASELNYHASKNTDLFKKFKPTEKRKIQTNPIALINYKIEQFKNSDTTVITELNGLTPDFNSYNSGDWHTLKKNQRWIGENVMAAMPFPEETTSVNLKISAMPLIKEGFANQQEVQIYLNDQYIDSIYFKKTTTIKYKLNVNNNNYPHILTLKMPNAIAPSSYSDANDSRKLSLYLSQFTLTTIK